ncbi:MAG: CDP-diacylglycerol--glycerol-3-phosphate 3-phosphatidyltransferase, partial [Eggerthellaceae bacterium]|nr:CDP-diacylglycerol--glycerol-3-phosphate 3-phosphatidyltransferase [Eggerthellaceae bacterium]
MAKKIRTREALLNPANVVTVLRISFVPVFFVALICPWPELFPFWPAAALWKECIAAIIFLILAGTDGLDGYLARKRNEITNFGKFMDPLADKILVVAALVALVELSALPSWVVIVIISREFIVSGIRMLAASQGVVIAASFYGKFKTVIQMAAIVLFIVKDSVLLTGISETVTYRLNIASWTVMIIALTLTLISLFDYIRKGRALLGFGQLPQKADAQDLLMAADEALAQEIIDVARERGLRIGTAESCSGGLLAVTLTGIAGSSDVFAGSVVSYSNEVKEKGLGVSPETLRAFGAVSSEVACEMALGAKEALGIDLAVAVTGIAGPG